MPFARYAGTSLCLLTFALPARAEVAETAVSEPAAPVAAEMPWQLHADFGLGGSSFGPYVGAAFIARYSALEFGATLDASGLFSSESGGGALAGLGFNKSPSFRIHLLGEGGAHYEHLTNGSLLSSDPGTSGTIAYVGGRVGLEWTLASVERPRRGTFGVWAFARTDVENRMMYYTYTNDGLFGTGRPESGQKRLGGVGEVGLALRLGVDFTP